MVYLHRFGWIFMVHVQVNMPVTWMKHAISEPSAKNQQ